MFNIYIHFHYHEGFNAFMLIPVEIIPQMQRAIEIEVSYKLELENNQSFELSISACACNERQNYDGHFILIALSDQMSIWNIDLSTIWNGKWASMIDMKAQYYLFILLFWFASDCFVYYTRFIGKCILIVYFINKRKIIIIQIIK